MSKKEKKSIQINIFAWPESWRYLRYKRCFNALYPTLPIEILHHFRWFDCFRIFCEITEEMRKPQNKLNNENLNFNPKEKLLQLTFEQYAK